MEIERTIRLKGRRGLEIACVQSMTDFRQHELATNVKVQQPVEEASKIGSVFDKVTEGADTEVDMDRGNDESSHVSGSNHFVLSVYNIYAGRYRETYSQSGNPKTFLSGDRYRRRKGLYCLSHHPLGSCCGDGPPLCRHIDCALL